MSSNRTSTTTMWKAQFLGPSALHSDVERRSSMDVEEYTWSPDHRSLWEIEAVELRAMLRMDSCRLRVASGSKATRRCDKCLSCLSCLQAGAVRIHVCWVWLSSSIMCPSSPVVQASVVLQCWSTSGLSTASAKREQEQRVHEEDDPHKSQMARSFLSLVRCFQSSGDKRGVGRRWYTWYRAQRLMMELERGVYRLAFLKDRVTPQRRWSRCVGCRHQCVKGASLHERADHERLSWRKPLVGEWMTNFSSQSQVVVSI